jgi:hypothetical protein
VIRIILPENATGIQKRHSGIFGCMVAATLGILLLDSLLFYFHVFYYYDDIHVLYPVAINSLEASFWPTTRPIQYWIVLAANDLYLPLWLAASLVCVAGAAVLSGLACEVVFERQLSQAGWWVLGVANPLLFYLVSQPDVVSQALCNLLFAGALLAFVSESRRLSDQPLRGWRRDKTAVFLNLMAAALFFSKETGAAAAVVIPAATALLRLKARRLSSLFLFSLLFPIVAAIVWIFLKLKYQSIMPIGGIGGRYDLRLDPITWVRNFVITFAFPITPLPSSFIAFEVLRQIWIVAATGCVSLFFALLLLQSLRQPKIVLPLIVVATSCAPMILIRTDELYPSMIAPFVVSIVLLFGMSQIPWPTLGYGLLLYAASVANGVIYCLGADFNLFGLHHQVYSIYGKAYQIDPICPIPTTAHIAWDGTAASDLPLEPGVHGRIICVR